jgi:uncharacterized protein
MLYALSTPDRGGGYSERMRMQESPTPSMRARTTKVLIPLLNGDTVSGIVSVPDQHVPGSTPAVLLGHGAGGDLSDPLLAYLQAFLRARGYLSLRFNFPYRESKRRVPDREPVLESAYTSAFAFLRDHPQLAPGPIFVGGRSMGGRIASQLVANGLPASGLLLLAYPLHAPGRPERVRDGHLGAIAPPTCFVSGTRDALAPAQALLQTAERLPRASLTWLVGADHSFHTLKSARRSAEDIWLELSEVVTAWLDQVRDGHLPRQLQPLPAADTASQTSPQGRSSAVPSAPKPRTATKQAQRVRSAVPSAGTTQAAARSTAGATKRSQPAKPSEAQRTPTSPTQPSAEPRKPARGRRPSPPNPR